MSSDNTLRVNTINKFNHSRNESLINTFGQFPARNSERTLKIRSKSGLSK